MGTSFRMTTKKGFWGTKETTQIWVDGSLVGAEEENPQTYPKFDFSHAHSSALSAAQQNIMMLVRQKLYDQAVVDVHTLNEMGAQGQEEAWACLMNLIRMGDKQGVHRLACVVDTSLHGHLALQAAVGQGHISMVRSLEPFCRAPEDAFDRMLATCLAIDSKIMTSLDIDDVISLLVAHTEPKHLHALLLYAWDNANGLAAVSLRAKIPRKDLMMLLHDTLLCPHIDRLWTAFLDVCADRIKMPTEWMQQAVARIVVEKDEKDAQKLPITNNENLCQQAVRAAVGVKRLAVAKTYLKHCQDIHFVYPMRAQIAAVGYALAAAQMEASKPKARRSWWHK